MGGKSRNVSRVRLVELKSDYSIKSCRVKLTLAQHPWLPLESTKQSMTVLSQHRLTGSGSYVTHRRGRGIALGDVDLRGRKNRLPGERQNMGQQRGTREIRQGAGRQHDHMQQVLGLINAHAQLLAVHRTAENTPNYIPRAGQMDACRFAMYRTGSPVACPLLNNLSVLQVVRGSRRFSPLLSVLGLHSLLDGRSAGVPVKQQFLRCCFAVAAGTTAATTTNTRVPSTFTYLDRSVVRHFAVNGFKRPLQHQQFALLTRVQGLKKRSKPRMRHRHTSILA